MRNNNTLPSFEQAGLFASMVGCKTPERWQAWLAGKTREDVWQQLISAMNGRIIIQTLEA